MKCIGKNQGQQGFTIIELMIAVAIVAILLKIALPSYMNQIQQSRRASAKTALLDLASREARYYSTNNAYSSSLTTLGYTGAGTATGSIAIPSTSTHYYDLTVTTNTGNTTFTGTAAPVSPQNSDACGTYTLDNYGNQTPTGSGLGVNCW